MVLAKKEELKLMRGLLRRRLLAMTAKVMDNKMMAEAAEKAWKGKKVVVVGSHPHAGEAGVVVGADWVAAMRRVGIKVKGSNGQEFYVFHKEHIKVI